MVVSPRLAWAEQRGDRSARLRARRIVRGRRGLGLSAEAASRLGSQVRVQRRGRGSAGARRCGRTRRGSVAS
eukprot:4302688-Alexandrium_andersonii.AAC.1